jgi:hypothetical protein
MGGIPLRLSASCLCFVVKTSTLRTSQQSTFASIPQYEQILLRFKTCHNCNATFFLSFWYSILVSFLFIAYDLFMNIFKKQKSHRVGSLLIQNNLQSKIDTHWCGTLILLIQIITKLFHVVIIQKTFLLCQLNHLLKNLIPHNLSRIVLI